MAIIRLDPATVTAKALTALGLADAGTDLFSPEALAALLRRAASFLCPTPSRSLVRSVVEIVNGLPGCDDDLAERLQTTLDAVVGTGDLLDLPSDDPDETGRRLYLGPPSFVRRASGACILLGVRPDGEPLLSSDLSGLVEYDGHLRLLRAGRDFPELLAAGGLQERQPGQWLHQPRIRPASDIVAEFVARLEAVGPSGEIESAQILDPASPVKYYQGRWRPLRPADNGMFVARRPQAYGADLWCVTRVEAGHITRLVDLPITDFLHRGADEAWRLQAAIDATLSHPQLARVRQASAASGAVLDLFAPLPAWAQRRLDLMGTPLLRSKGALFSYSLPSTEVWEEVAFLEQALWMSLDE